MRIPLLHKGRFSLGKISTVPDPHIMTFEWKSVNIMGSNSYNPAGISESNGHISRVTPKRN